MQTGKIKIDDRESNFIFNGFSKENIEYEKVRLEIGDFQFGDVVVEHKTVEDFVQSFRSGHLQKQLLQQEQNYKHSFLLISGDFDRLFFNPHLKGCTREQIMGMIVSINVRFKTKIIQTIMMARVFKTNENKIIADLVSKLIEKGNDNKNSPTIYNTELLKSSLKTEDIYLKMLLCLEGLGVERGKKILEKWSFFELRNVTKEQLKEIDGIGDKLADKIKKYIF